MTDTKNVLAKEGEEVLVKNEASVDPSEFFKTRSGLYVFSDFPDRILSKAKAVEAGTEFKLQEYKLTAWATDEQIEAELPKDHLFDESEVCAIIADLIAKQEGGKEGTLDATGNWNLFYTPAFVVSVYWYAGRAEWNVLTWHRGDYEWDADDRVFSPATEN